MEVDSVDGADSTDLLVNQLNMLGTRDREDLLTQFHNIVGPQILKGTCEFYLEMGNWNLQTALCSFYDVTWTGDDASSAVTDGGDMLTSRVDPPAVHVVSESEHINPPLLPQQPFTKTWRVHNTGNVQWPIGGRLRFLRGRMFGDVAHVEVAALAPGQTVDVAVGMTAPAEVGQHEGYWQFVSFGGGMWGPHLCVVVVVQNVGATDVQGLTEQMASLSPQKRQGIASTSGTLPRAIQSQQNTMDTTPFCSPTGYGMFGQGNRNDSMEPGNSPFPPDFTNDMQATLLNNYRSQYDDQLGTENGLLPDAPNIADWLSRTHVGTSTNDDSMAPDRTDSFGSNKPSD